MDAEAPSSARSVKMEGERKDVLIHSPDEPGRHACSEIRRRSSTGPLPTSASPQTPDPQWLDDQFPVALRFINESRTIPGERVIGGEPPRTTVLNTLPQSPAMRSQDY
jgi:hypothetical protein